MDRFLNIRYIVQFLNLMDCKIVRSAFRILKEGSVAAAREARREHLGEHPFMESSLAGMRFNRFRRLIRDELVIFGHVLFASGFCFILPAHAIHGIISSTFFLMYDICVILLNILFLYSLIRQGIFFERYKSVVQYCLIALVLSWVCSSCAWGVTFSYWLFVRDRASEALGTARFIATHRITNMQRHR